MQPADILYQISTIWKNMFFIQFAIFLLIFILVYLGISKTKAFEEKPIALIISLTIAAIAIRYISSEAIKSQILMPYKSLGILLLFTLPYFLILIFLHKSNTTKATRTVTWIIFGTIVTLVWYTDYQKNNLFESYALIYGLGLIALSIILDKQLHKFLKN